jgi:DNA-binding NtrC family response regulator
MGDETEARVLVVDDDAPSVEAAQTMLSLSGFTVRGAQNGATGLEEVLTFRPDVVVFDFWMPVADGRELLQGIREVARGRMGLVAMSGTPEVEDWCGRVGVNQFIRKPFDRHALLEAVRRALEEARTASVRNRSSSSMPAAHRLRVDRAVMVVGSRENVRAVRHRLREGERPVQVAVVEGVDDAVRALGSFQLDAIAVCGVHDDPMLPALIAAASVRGLPVVLDRPSESREVSSPRVYVAESTSADAMVNLIQGLVAGPRVQ